MAEIVTRCEPVPLIDAIGQPGQATADGASGLKGESLKRADEKPDGEPQLVIDNLGAGLDSRVLICNDGTGTRNLMGSKNSPVRWFVMGICDQ